MNRDEMKVWSEGHDEGWRCSQLSEARLLIRRAVAVILVSYGDNFQEWKEALKVIFTTLDLEPGIKPELKLRILEWLSSEASTLFQEMEGERRDRV